MSTIKLVLLVIAILLGLEYGLQYVMWHHIEHNAFAIGLSLYTGVVIGVLDWATLKDTPKLVDNHKNK